ncbi:MAG: leucyl aminopeptidase [Dehalococcoidia bacterium]|nr:MAG: leucyl aminopeptidase [Dehalococcoidia bacterium]
MDIRVKAGKLAQQTADALVAGLFEGEKKLPGDLADLDKALGGVIAQSVKQERLTGKLGESQIFHSTGDLSASLVAIIGLGKKDKFTPDKLRGDVAGLCRTLRQNKAYSIAIQTPGAGITGITPADAAQAITEGAILGLYTFRRHITKKPEYAEVKELTIIAPSAGTTAMKNGVARGRILAEAANLARDMVNEPSNYMTPADIAGIAQDIARKHKLELAVMEKKEMAALGMGGVLSVSQGSSQAPKFIVMRYKGRSTQAVDLALVGKGVTFDSGGISIKPSENMGDMKGDMAGAASVIAAMSAIAQLKPKLNVTAIVAAVENMPSGHAYKPGDVVKAMNGKTIEVITTDAEGRITLADALSYANAKIKAKNILDVATLTGACVVALGHVCSAVFTNKQELADRVVAASKKAGELSWQMPMFEEYKEQNKSDVADMKNTGGRPGGAITAAQFLGEFAGDTPWVHMDIAGVDLSDKEHGYLVKGATGIPVRTLVNLVLNMAQK